MQEESIGRGLGGEPRPTPGPCPDARRPDSREPREGTGFPRRRPVLDRRLRRELIERLNRDAERIAARFGLRYRVIEPERANVKRRYGICYSDGTIRIRLRHSVSGRPLKYSSLVATLCHELAHLRHFDHGPRFRDFNQTVLAWARDEGIYRPGRSRPRGLAPLRPAGPVRPATEPAAPARTAIPRQLDLFG